MSMQLLTFKTPIVYNKAKTSLNVCVIFDFRNIAIVLSVKKVLLPKYSMVTFSLFYFQKKFEKSIVL